LASELIKNFCVGKFDTKFGMGCIEELDRHVNTPPSFSATIGFVVNRIWIFPEDETVTDL
jgi:hypothetical protein